MLQTGLRVIARDSSHTQRRRCGIAIIVLFLLLYTTHSITLHVIMTTDTSISSSSFSRAENGRNKNRRSGVVFDAASEDDPLLQEPLLMLPTNVQIPLPDAYSSYSSSQQEQAPEPPPPPNSDFHVFTKPAERETKQVIRYESDSHFHVLFQMYGSVWPAVLPYCIVSVLITALISYLQSHDIVDLTFASSTGHSFMAIM